MTSHCTGTVYRWEESESGIRKWEEKVIDESRRWRERDGSSDVRWKTVPQTSGCDRERYVAAAAVSWHGQKSVVSAYCVVPFPKFYYSNRTDLLPTCYEIVSGLNKSLTSWLGNDTVSYRFWGIPPLCYGYYTHFTELIVIDINNNSSAELVWQRQIN